ncbi:MAG: ABC transporter substrate-binding protein, partial [Paludibacteraceae bacterium]|nr:ABC transporter substrate-binding protein [Paludibacteraceae bacterium]
KGYDADVWLFLYGGTADKTYKDLDRFSCFKSYKNRRVFACNTEKLPYYDVIPFHPERLLNDIYLIVHSEKNEDLIEKLQYYSKLAE